MPKRKTNNKKIALISGGIIATLVLIYVAMAYSPFPSEPTPITGNSSFTLISYVDGEDVSDFVEISIWVPDSDAEFDEVEDIYTWSNFEEEESSKDADDVSIDLSGISYAWLEIDPDAEQVFANTHILLYGGANFDYEFYVYHQSSDVNFGIVNATGGQTWGNFTTGVGVGMPYGGDSVFLGAEYADAEIAENMTLSIKVPKYTHANIHVGTNWGIEQTEYDDMSTSELEHTHDEANWRCQAPTYAPADDLEKEGDDDLEQITNGFAIRWTYNTTVSTTGGTTTNINMTITDNADAEVVIDGTYIYMIFYNVIKFDTGSYVLEFEYEEAGNIYATALESGRIVVPRDEDALGTFTAYSLIGM